MIKNGGGSGQEVQTKHGVQDGYSVEGNRGEPRSRAGRDRLLWTHVPRSCQCFLEDSQFGSFPKLKRLSYIFSKRPRFLRFAEVETNKKKVLPQDIFCCVAGDIIALWSLLVFLLKEFVCWCMRSSARSFNDTRKSRSDGKHFRKLGSSRDEPKAWEDTLTDFSQAAEAITRCKHW